MLGSVLVKEWLENPEGLWEKAVPQGEGEYWKRPTANDRVLDVNSTPDKINRMIRACSRDGFFIKTNDGYRLSYTGYCQSAEHDYPAGTVLHENNAAFYSCLCVAVNGGFLYATGITANKKRGFVYRAKRKLRRMMLSVTGKR